MVFRTSHFAHAARAAAASAAAFLMMLATACGSSGTASQGTSTDGDGKADTSAVSVVASVNQWGLLAAQIGGDKAEVTSILGATNVDAHDFEPSTSDIAKISKADLVVVNGAGYDEWAVKAAGDSTQVSAAQAIGAMDGDNPHLWFSKDARQAMAKELADAFSKARPANASYYEQRLGDWQKDEADLEKDMDEFAKEHPDLPYAATESVAYYLASDLGMKDATPKGYTQAIANEGEPAPADVQEFQQVLEGRKARLLVVNPQEGSDVTALITGTAGRSDVPTVQVTEQVPEGTTSLIDWMEALIDDFDKAADQSKGSESDGKDDDAGGKDASGTSRSGGTGASPQSDSSTSGTAANDAR